MFFSCSSARTKALSFFKYSSSIRNRWFSAKSYKGEVGKIAPNVISRNFETSKPFEKLATDVTEFAVCDDKVYLSPVIDLHNNEVISYSISTSPNFEQTREMLKRLFDKLPKDARPILHSDQGWQYQMKEFQRSLCYEPQKLDREITK